MSLATSMLQIWPNPGRMWPSAGRTQARCAPCLDNNDQTRPVLLDSSQLRPRPTDLGPMSGSNSTEFDRTSINFGPASTNLSPTSTKYGPKSQIGQYQPNMSRSQPNLAWTRPKLARMRPGMAQFQPNSNSAKLGPKSVKFGPMSTKFGSTKSGPISAQSCATEGGGTRIILERLSRVEPCRR